MTNNFKRIFSTALLLGAGFFLHAQITPRDYLEDILSDINPPDYDEIPETQKNLTVVMQRGNLDLNPHTSAYTDEAQILNSLYEGLFTYSPITSEPENALVDSYTVSRDMLVYNFKLKEAQFSSGRQITAQDFKDSWIELLKTPGAYYASFLDVIKGAKALRLGKGEAEDVAIFVKDNLTLRIELESPAAHLPKILCLHAFSVIDLKDSSFSGPYCLTDVTPTKIILKKNSFYREEGAVHIPQVNILFSSDSEDNTTLFNAGVAQWISADCNAKTILDKSAVDFYPLFGTYYFFFKLKNKVLSPKIRQALMEATPWKKLREGSLCPAPTLVYPITGYTSPSALDYTDPDHAKELIKEARKELRLKDKEEIELTFEIPEGDSIYEAARILKYAWGEIGVRLNIKVNSNPAYISEISKMDSDLFIYTWIGDFPDPVAFLELFRSDSSLNETFWADKKYDELLDKASRTKNSKERLDILSQAEDLLLSAGVIIPLTHSIDMNIVDKNEIGGFYENALGIHPFRYMYFKKAKSQFKYGKVAKF